MYDRKKQGNYMCSLKMKYYHFPYTPSYNLFRTRPIKHMQLNLQNKQKFSKALASNSPENRIESKATGTLIRCVRTLNSLVRKIHRIVLEMPRYLSRPKRKLQPSPLSSSCSVAYKEHKENQFTKRTIDKYSFHP